MKSEVNTGGVDYVSSRRELKRLARVEGSRRRELKRLARVEGSRRRELKRWVRES